MVRVLCSVCVSTYATRYNLKKGPVRVRVHLLPVFHSWNQLAIPHTHAPTPTHTPHTHTPHIHFSILWPELVAHKPSSAREPLSLMSPLARLSLSPAVRSAACSSLTPHCPPVGSNPIASPHSPCEHFLQRNTLTAAAGLYGCAHAARRCTRTLWAGRTPTSGGTSSTTSRRAPTCPARAGRRRGCHSADALSLSLLKLLINVEGVRQNDSLVDGQVQPTAGTSPG